MTHTENPPVVKTTVSQLKSVETDSELRFQSVLTDFSDETGILIPGGCGWASTKFTPRNQTSSRSLVSHHRRVLGLILPTSLIKDKFD